MLQSHGAQADLGALARLWTSFDFLLARAASSQSHVITRVIPVTSASLQWDWDWRLGAAQRAPAEVTGITLVITCD